jgi:hypothetical protein
MTGGMDGQHGAPNTNHYKFTGKERNLKKVKSEVELHPEYGEHATCMQLNRITPCGLAA